MAFGTVTGTFTVAANSITNPTDLVLATGSAVVHTGDLVYVAAGQQTANTTGTVTDNLGNVYTQTQNGTLSGTSVSGHAYYSRVTVAGTITVIHVAATGSTANAAMAAVLIDGPFITSPLDANPTNITSDVASPFTCPLTGTLAQAAEVVIAWGVSTGATVWAATSPNLLATQIASQSVLETVIGTQVVAATTSIAPEFTSTGTPVTAAVLGVSSFKQDLSKPFHQDNWPNPVLRPSPRDAVNSQPGVWQNQLPGLLSYVPPDTTHELRAPVYTPRWPVRALAVGIAAANLLLTTLAPSAPVAPPFDQTEWPNPRGAIGSVALRTWLNPLNLNLLGQDRVYGGPGQVSDYDWPNPIRAKPRVFDYQQSVNVGLLAAIAAPFNQDNWPNPLRRVDNRLVADPLNLTGRLLTPFSQDDWPNPRGARRSPDYQQSTSLALYKADTDPYVITSSLNYVLTSSGNKITVGPIVFGPFAQFDWPNPKGPQPRPYYQQSINLGLLTTTGTKPFSQTNWPNPLIRIAYRLVADPPNLTGGLLAPFSQDNWPNPKGYAPRSDYQQATNLGLLTTTGTAPFSQDDWPNPPGYRRGQDYQQAINLGLLTTTGTKPFLQPDWPNPKGYAPRPDYQQSLNFNLLAPEQAPFAQDNWPNPLGYRRGQDYQQSINLGLLTTTGTKPFLQTEWPNPVRRPVYRLVADPPNITGQLLPPFAQLDWPNPRGAARLVVGEQRQLDLGLLLAVQAPFSQDDWPNPKGYQPRPSYQQSINLGLLTTTGTKPFLQLDWSNPRAAARLVVGEQRQTNLALYTVVQAPFSQRDWPNPRGKVSRPDYTQSKNLCLIGQDVIYGDPGQAPGFDWPQPRSDGPLLQGHTLGTPITLTVAPPAATAEARTPLYAPYPRIRARSVSLYTWVQSYNLNLIGQDVIYGAPGQAPGFDWPQPRGIQPSAIVPAVRNTALLTVVTQAPFKQTEWHNPRGLRSRDYQQFQTNLGLLTTTGTKPFLQTEWPNPRGAARLVVGEQRQLDLGLLLAIPSPFSQDDWPNPKGYAPRPDYQQSTSLGLLTTTGTKPFLQTEWPVPKGHPPRQSYQQSLNLSLRTTTGTKPFAQSDWPNPVRRLVYRLVADSPNLTFNLLSPFSQHEWPNPRGYQPRQSYQQALNLGLRTTTGTKPFLQTEWPVPKGHPPRQDYRLCINTNLFVGIIHGTFSGTDGADLAAFTGKVFIDGIIAATEGADLAAFSGDVLIQGTFSGTDGADLAVFIGDLEPMPQPFIRVRFRSLTISNVDFGVGPHVIGYHTPAEAGVPHGTLITYIAESANEGADPSWLISSSDAQIAKLQPIQWEVGLGVYDAFTNTVSRGTVLASSDAGAKIFFDRIPIVRFKDFP